MLLRRGARELASGPARSRLRGQATSMCSIDLASANGAGIDKANAKQVIYIRSFASQRNARLAWLQSQFRKAEGGLSTKPHTVEPLQLWILLCIVLTDAELLEVVDRTAKNAVIRERESSGQDGSDLKTGSSPLAAGKVLTRTPDNVLSKRLGASRSSSYTDLEASSLAQAKAKVETDSSEGGLLSQEDDGSAAGPIVPGEEIEEGTCTDKQVVASNEGSESLSTLPESDIFRKEGVDVGPQEAEVGAIHEAESFIHHRVESSTLEQTDSPLPKLPEVGESGDETAGDVSSRYPEELERSTLSIDSDTTRAKTSAVGQVNMTLSNGHLEPADQTMDEHTEETSADEGHSRSANMEVDSIEAQVLLKIASSGGQTKEARLAKVCANLSARLHEYKAENVQLEELLLIEREERASVDKVIKHFEQQLSTAQATAASMEADLAGALAVKSAEMAALTSALHESRQRASAAEAKATSLQATAEVLTRTRDMSEARIIQALREELISAEQRVEEERLAHVATRQDAVGRENDLEQQLTENVAALTRMQRSLEDRASKNQDLEQRITMLESDCAALNEELQKADARLKREQKRPSEDAGSSIQASCFLLLSYKHGKKRLNELGKPNGRQRAPMFRWRVELAASKRDIDSGSAQAQGELEKKFRELTELLAQAEREQFVNRSGHATDDEEQGLRSLTLGPKLHQRKSIVGPSLRSAVKLLDRGTVQAGKFLWRRPVARIVVFFYLVFVHLFLLYLLGRLQDLAETLEGAVASKAGSLANSKDLFPGMTRQP
eukprot:SM000079S22491  [mRNA]  locus=s79:517709:524303:+ [translate_table: standard]